MNNTLQIKLGNALKDLTGALRNIDNDHAYIHEKKKFSAFHKGSIAAGQTLLFSFKTPATGVIHYRPAKIYPSADKVDWELYEGATINVAGTLLTNTNRNRNSPPNSTVELRYGTTFTGNGTLLPGMSVWLPGSTGVGQSRTGGDTSDADEVVLKPDTVYRMVLTNGSSGANVVGFNFNWYEEES